MLEWVFAVLLGFLELEVHYCMVFVLELNMFLKCFLELEVHYCLVLVL